MIRSEQRNAIVHLYTCSGDNFIFISNTYIVPCSRTHAFVFVYHKIKSKPSLSIFLFHFFFSNSMRPKKEKNLTKNAPHIRRDEEKTTANELLYCAREYGARKMKTSKKTKRVIFLRLPQRGFLRFRLETLYVLRKNILKQNWPVRHEEKRTKLDFLRASLSFLASLFTLRSGNDLTSFVESSTRNLLLSV